MPITDHAFSRPVLLWGIPVVVGHFLVVLWHLFLLFEVQPNPPGFLAPLLISINLIPVAGLLVFAKGFSKLAGVMVTIPLGVAFVAGTSVAFLEF